MKKNYLLNSHISYAIASLGHKQTIAIVDAGCPVFGEHKKIDLALCPGTPSFLSTLDAVLSEMCVEKITLAKEIDTSPNIKGEIISRFDGKNTEYVTHEEFKELLNSAVAVIRTGETTPYANIILTSGVTF